MNQACNVPSWAQRSDGTSQTRNQVHPKTFGIVCETRILRHFLKKMAPEQVMAKYRTYYQIWFLPTTGEKWRRSEDAPTSCTGLSLLSPHLMQGGGKGSSETGLGKSGRRKRSALSRGSSKENNSQSFHPKKQENLGSVSDSIGSSCD